MKHLCYSKKGVIYEPIKWWKTDEVTEVAIYQGFRGPKPELDIIVKYRELGKRLRTPTHTHWIVDLLIKCEYSKDLVNEYVETILDFYETTEPFKSVEERKNYELSFYKRFDYEVLNSYGYYKIDTLTSFLELFTKCEKLTENAFMFKNLLKLVQDYCLNKKDFYQIVGLSKKV